MEPVTGARYPFEPRQEWIYGKLMQLVGPGPAAFYKDACLLMTESRRLESTTHLVSHLLREIESALRHVLEPNHHPSRLDAESPLWTSFESAGSTKPLEYYAFRKMLSVTASRANIGKRVNPHSFRQARASNLANVLTEAEMKEYLGWVGDSRMASTYVHLSGRNIDNALLKLNGIKTEDEVNNEEHTLRIKTWLRCQEVNSPTSGFCSRCGCPLDVKTAMQLHEEESKTDNVMDWLVDDPELELLRSKIKAMAIAMAT